MFVLVLSLTEGLHSYGIETKGVKFTSFKYFNFLKAELYLIKVLLFDELLISGMENDTA